MGGSADDAEGSSIPPLYHFTAPTTSHLGQILAERVIRPTESNVTYERERAGPDVVWLTSNPDPAAHQGWAASGPKVLARLSVSVNGAVHYPEWASMQHVSSDVYERLAESGGDPDDWWVYEGPIRSTSIIELKFWTPTEDGSLGEATEFDGRDLKKLFESRGRQRALQLPKTRKHQYRVVQQPNS